MSRVQSIKLVVRDVLRSVTLCPVLLLSLAACADDAQKAAEAGALAEQQFLSGDLTSARQSINAAIARRDDDVTLHLLRGRIEVAAGSFGAAYDAFSDALALDPANGLALQGVSQLGLRTGHAFESLQATNRILTLSPDQPDALLTRGIHALVRRRHDEALGYADRLLALNPRHEDASVLKARALFLQGKTGEALASLDAVSGNGRAGFAVAQTKLEIFRELRRPADMAEQFKLLRTSRPDDQALRLDEANFWFKLGDPAQANELVASALAQPELGGELIDQALKLWEEYGIGSLADSHLRNIVANGSKAARQGVARFMIEQGEYDMANRIMSFLPAGERTALLARMLSATKQYQRAARAAGAVLEDDRTECDALIAHSQASLGLGKQAAALESGQRAAAECPQQISAWLAAAEAYMALGRPSGTERIYSQGFDAHPQSLRLTQDYAEWLWSRKRGREAVAIARRLTQNAPALMGGWRYYASICQRTTSPCQDDAARGLANAETFYGVDLEPGAAAPNSLFGRLVRR